MVSLVLMYVYFDASSDIKAITPAPDSSLGNTFSVTTFPLSEVETFLTGQRNPFNYTVQMIKRGLNISYKIAKKESTIVLTRTLDNYLTLVDDKNKYPILIITTELNKRFIHIRLDKEFKDLLSYGTDNEQEEVTKFLNNGLSTLYFTKKNNPYYLLTSVTFSPQELFDIDILTIEYKRNIDLSNSSVYTKKLINSYGYIKV